jgi:diguanylate cyclase (GGDEF)-like protein
MQYLRSSPKRVTSGPSHRTYHGAVFKVSRLDLSAFPDSPYAAELEQGPSNLRFAPRLEAEYLQSRLSHDRTLIRMACVLAVVLALCRGVEQTWRGAWKTGLLIEFAFVVASTIALAAIAWSPSFERQYSRWARCLVPLRNSIIVAQIAAAAAHGQPEMLMVLSITVIGPFFFLGLQFRTALFCCALTVASYVMFTILFGLAPPIALRSYVFLLAGVPAWVYGAWSLEKISRRSFLEGRFIAELAQRDALTGTRNRRVFDERLGGLWQQAIDQGRRIAILLIDIDHFKAYNDCYGHQSGDETLRRVAQTAQRFVCNSPDVLTRYGGEEFAAILYDVDGNQAREVADRMRRAVRDLAIEHVASQTTTRVTISVGVAAVQPTADRSPLGAVQLADQALYGAKMRGRNRVEFLDGTQHDLLVTGAFSIARARVASGDVR